MPNRKQHIKLSEILLGYSNPYIHSILDSKIKGIQEHRATHNPRTVRGIASIFGEEAKVEAWLHIFCDYDFINWREIIGVEKKKDANLFNKFNGRT